MTNQPSHSAAPTIVAAPAPIDPGTVIGHVHLKVSDLERSVAFYTGAFGFEVMQRWGDSAAFLSAGGYHHHLGLNTWESKGGAPAPRHSPACITWRFCIPRAGRWPWRSSVWSKRACKSTARPIMA